MSSINPKLCKNQGCNTLIYWERQGDKSVPYEVNTSERHMCKFYNRDVSPQQQHQQHQRQQLSSSSLPPLTSQQQFPFENLDAKLLKIIELLEIIIHQNSTLEQNTDLTATYARQQKIVMEQLRNTMAKEFDIEVEEPQQQAHKSDEY